MAVSKNVSQRGPAHADVDDHGTGNQDDEDGGAQVRLLHDEQRRPAQKEQRIAEVAEAEPLEDR